MTGKIKRLLLLNLPYFFLALGATKMACPELALEADYLAALSAVTQVEESESRLVLAGPGVELVFLRP